MAATGDGASVMTSFGRIMPFEYLLCLNHTINLAVIDVLFPKKSKLPVSERERSEEIEDDENDQSEDGPEVSVIQDYEEFHSSVETYETTVARMLAIVKFLRYSPTRSNLLKEALVRRQMKVLELLTFTKTRWNSLVICGKRFLELLPAVLETVNETLGNWQLPWEYHDTEVLQVRLFSIKY